MDIMKQPDTDVILYSANNTNFGLNKESVEKSAELSQHYQGGAIPDVIKEVVNLKEMAERIKFKLSEKELFFIKVFAERAIPVFRGR